MRKNFNHGFSPQFVPKFEDGVVQSLPVDNFPVADKSHYKQDGWPLSDIGLLDRFVRDQVDKEQIEKIAGRLEAIKASPRNDKTDDQLLLELRPAWVQTASELADYEKILFEIQSLQKSEVLMKEETTTTTQDLVEPNSSDTNVSSSDD